MDDLEPSQRNNIILLVDESHRSQKGKGAGFAMTMRAKLPKAFRFGTTGTPIDRTMVNTPRDFGHIQRPALPEEAQNPVKTCHFRHGSKAGNTRRTGGVSPRRT